jgi:hypothetical protein
MRVRLHAASRKPRKPAIMRRREHRFAISSRLLPSEIASPAGMRGYPRKNPQSFARARERERERKGDAALEIFNGLRVLTEGPTHNI